MDSLLKERIMDNQKEQSDDFHTCIENDDYNEIISKLNEIKNTKDYEKSDLIVVDTLLDRLENIKNDNVFKCINIDKASKGICKNGEYCRKLLLQVKSYNKNPKFNLSVIDHCDIPPKYTYKKVNDEGE